MQEPRWSRRALPAITSLAAFLILGVAGSSARVAPDRSWPPPACDGQPDAARQGPGAWFRLAPRLDALGALVGQRLVVGSAASSTTRTWDLSPESFASSPRGRTVLVGTDDGRRSSLALLDVVDGCAWPIADEPDVVRRAILSPAGDGLAETRVARGDRSDLGIWRRSLGADRTPSRIMAALSADPIFGRTFSTELAWSAEGTTLAVQSCGAQACRARVVELGSGRLAALTMPEMGPMIGLLRDRLITYAVCPGLPCALLSVGTLGGAVQVLAQASRSAAVMEGGPVGPRVVIESGSGALGLVAPDGSQWASLPALPDGVHLIAAPPGASAAWAPETGTFLVGPDSADPFVADIADAARLQRRSIDGRVRPFLEVSR